MPHETLPSARDLLAFYIEAGVDCALSDEAVNRLEETAPVADPPTTSRPSMLRPPPPPVPRGEIAPAPEIAIMAARELAPTASSLDELRKLLEGFDGCALKATATRLVFSDGNPTAKVMFVGEAPGRDEDLEGLPFVGRSGKLLDLMLAAIGFDRSNVYIANIIPWRPPGNRDPSPQETQICLPFIKRQIQLVDPDFLVCLGQTAARAVLEQKDGIAKLRGKWFDYDTGSRKIKVMAMLHPEYLINQPTYKRQAWQDLLELKKTMTASATST